MIRYTKIKDNEKLFKEKYYNNVLNHHYQKFKKKVPTKIT